MTYLSKLIPWITLLACSIAQGKIVDVSSESNKEAKPGFSGTVKASYDESSGNTDKENYQGSLKLRYVMDNHTFLLMGQSERGEVAGVRYSESDFIHARYRYAILEWLDWELFTQRDRNPFRGLSNRFLLGTGPRFSYQSESFLAFLGIMYMKENEEYLDGLMDEDSQENDRLSSYLTLRYQLQDKVELVSSNYYQPKLEDSSQYRLVSNSGFSFKLTERLSYDFTLAITYDAEPPATVERQDRKISHSLSFSI